MSLQNAFVEQEMPMSISGAIKAARELNDYYTSCESNSFYHYRHPYSYAKDDNMEKIATLISKEANLMDKWISQKFGEEESVEITQNPKKYLAEICSEIYGSLQGFGLNLHSQALHLMTLPTHKDEEIERPDSERER